MNKYSSILCDNYHIVLEFFNKESDNLILQSNQPFTSKLICE